MKSLISSFKSLAKAKMLITQRLCLKIIWKENISWKRKKKSEMKKKLTDWIMIAKKYPHQAATWQTKGDNS